MKLSTKYCAMKDLNNDPQTSSYLFSVRWRNLGIPVLSERRETIRKHMPKLPTRNVWGCYRLWPRLIEWKNLVLRSMTTGGQCGLFAVRRCGVINAELSNMLRSPNLKLGTNPPALRGGRWSENMGQRGGGTPAWWRRAHQNPRQDYSERMTVRFRQAPPVWKWRDHRWNSRPRKVGFYHASFQNFLHQTPTKLEYGQKDSIGENLTLQMSVFVRKSANPSASPSQRGLSD